MKYEVIFVTEIRERYIVDSQSKEEAEKIASARYLSPKDECDGYCERWSVEVCEAEEN